MELEYLPVVDENDIVVDKKLRELVHRDGDFHRVSHVWVINSNGKVLCNKRSSNKDVVPNKWDTVMGGHVEYDSNYEDTAVNELKDEYGINVNKDELIFLCKIPHAIDTGNVKCKKFITAFAVKFDGDVNSLKINQNEVEELRFMKLSDLENISKDENKRKGFVGFDYFDIAVSKIRELL